MCDDQMGRYFDGLAVLLTMPRLDIAALVGHVHTVGYQATVPGNARSGLGPSCDYCIDLAIHDGTHTVVECLQDLWICLFFFRKKVGPALLNLMVLRTKRVMCLKLCVLFVTILN